MRLRRRVHDRELAGGTDLLIGKDNALYGLTQEGGGRCDCGAVSMIKGVVGFICTQRLGAATI